MKNEHLLLVWEEVSTTRRNICEKLRRFMRIFFLQLCINDANHSCKQIPHNVATRHDIIQINIFRKNMVAVRGCVTSAAILCT